MTGLILAESAIFTIFVVTYLFYLGKSLAGPSPKQALELPIINTICLLSSSASITFAVSALRRSREDLFRICGSSHRFGRVLPGGDGTRVGSSDPRRTDD